MPTPDTTRWTRLADQAAQLRREDRIADPSVSGKLRKATQHAMYRLEAAIAATEGPEVARRAVTRWLIQKLPVAECVVLAKTEPARTPAGGLREVPDTPEMVWRRAARAAAYQAEGLAAPG